MAELDMKKGDNSYIQEKPETVITQKEINEITQDDKKIGKNDFANLAYDELTYNTDTVGIVTQAIRDQLRSEAEQEAEASAEITNDEGGQR